MIIFYLGFTQLNVVTSETALNVKCYLDPENPKFHNFALLSEQTKINIFKVFSSYRSANIFIRWTIYS